MGCFGFPVVFHLNEEGNKSSHHLNLFLLKWKRNDRENDGGFNKKYKRERKAVVVILIAETNRAKANV